MARFRPKIVYILSDYDPATGSHFFHIYELLKAAAEELDIFLVVEKSKVLPVDLSPSFYVQRFRFLPLRFLELFAVLIRERTRGRRFFYTHYSFFGGVASWLAASVSGGKSYYWNCGMPWLYRRGFFEEAVFRFVMRRNILVTGTPKIAEEYRKHYGLSEKKIRVVPNWINVERFAAVRPVGGKEFDERFGARKVVLFLHRLSRRKGVHLLPEIIAKVTGHDKNVIFVIVGRGPEEESLKARIRRLRLEPYVWFAGEVPHREVSRYFRAAQVFIMPSEEEGFPHVLLEAQALGVPYVACDVGGVREITPPALGRFIVPAHDPAASVRKVVEILAMDSLERLRLAKIMTEWVSQYDIANVQAKFCSLFS